MDGATMAHSIASMSSHAVKYLEPVRVFMTSGLCHVDTRLAGGHAADDGGVGKAFAAEQV